MNRTPAVEVAHDLLQSDYQLIGKHGYMATELQDGTILAAEYRNETRLEGDSGNNLEAEFEFTPLWGAHPSAIQKWADELGIEK